MTERLLNVMRYSCGIDEETVPLFIRNEVLEKASKLNESFLKCMTQVTSTTKKLSNVAFAPLGVTTLTITGKFTNNGVVDELPVTFIRESLSERTDENGLHLGVQKIKKHRASTYKPPADVRKFRHQVAFKLGKKSAKLFYNGTVHATGFSSIVDFLHMSLIIAEFVRDITNGELIMTLSDFNINMINAGTLVTNRGNMPLSYSPKFIAQQVEKAGHHADFDVERHPAVKIMLFDKKKKLSTGFIFATGNIVIFGSREPEHVAKMFDIIAKTLDDAHEVATATPPRTTTVRKSFDLTRGYTTNSYKLCA